MNNFNYRPRTEGDNALGSVRPSVCPFVCALTVEPFDIRDSALTSAAKSNKSHYQSRVLVCVSVISRRIGIIARMRSIGVLIWWNFEAFFNQISWPFMKLHELFSLVRLSKKDIFAFFMDPSQGATLIGCSTHMLHSPDGLSKWKWLSILIKNFRKFVLISFHWSIGRV